MQLKSIREIAFTTTLPAANETEHGVYLVKKHARWVLHIARPELIEEFMSKIDGFAKEQAVINPKTLLGRFIGGRNLLTLDGDEWIEQHKIMKAAFDWASPLESCDAIGQKLITRIGNMDNGSVNWQRLANHWALDLLGKTLFDFDFGAIDGTESQWSTRYRSIFHACFHPLYLMLPILDTWLLSSKRRHMHQELTTLLCIMDDRIKQASNLPNESESLAEKDLLKLILEARKEHPENMKDEDIRSNFCAFFMVGHRALTYTLAMAVYHIAANQAIQQKAREEVIAIMGPGGYNRHDMPTLAQISEMPYIEYVIKETMRMHPPTPVLHGRVAKEDISLGNLLIPKGTQVSLDIYELHHNSVVWKNPETFDPLRFAPRGEVDQLNSQGKLAWLPFNHHPRQCIGKDFSLMALKVTLAMLVQCYDISLPNDSPHKDGIDTVGYTGISPTELVINFTKRHEAHY
ncbi:cytochrome p450 [Lichtheimia corymbifera JMRC:FSU:9682]|uniref:Cytochrome p450 n=1 Tax=Lichtheimia corymbifera JMRC:FSU:9682 TaxID=1263082 RepID=A0A068S3R6_9FUNG|nr:cytochrome p450 [Lichtheimia corymbifera JMRC:FSU:9682]